MVILLARGNSNVENTILARLLAISNRYPDSVALLDVSGCSLTFQELAEQANNFRSQLLSYGLGRGSRAALVIPAGLDMAFAFLGTTCSCTAAPLNLNYREEEYLSCLKELRPEAVIVHSGSSSPVSKAAANLRIPVYELEREGGDKVGWRLLGERNSKSVLENEVQEDDIAYIAHTSGSASRPKMVPLRQRNVLATIDHIIQYLGLCYQDRMLGVMPLFHSHGLLCLLAPLLAGGSVVCTPGFNIDGFFSWLERFAPTCYSAVPTMNQAILAEAGKAAEIIRKNRLRFIRSASAPLPQQVRQELEQTFKAPVVDSYGTTEATYLTCSPLPPAPDKAGSVGLSAGPQIAILDGNGKILPNGEKGEIAARGPNVMDGSLSNAEATTNAFVDGWFRTGDEGYLDEDNYLYVTGRIKEMINRGGEKVTPFEVDQVFLSHPLVAQAITFAVPHPSLGEDVSTAIVLKSNAQASEKDLRQYALTRLSDQKAPSRVVILAELPTTPTGKLERMDLYQKLSPYLQAEYVPARNSIEVELVNMVEEILNSGQVGIHDNFFYLGGNSLTAAALINRINNNFQIELPIGEVFRRPTIEELADHIQERVIQPLPGKKKPDLSADILDYLDQF